MENREYFAVLQYIKTLIMQGKLNIGDKLPTERHLSETLALSRNTVRDAIRIMSSMGLVESRQGSGNYLSNKISRNISATVDFMLLLEQSNYLEINQIRRAIALECFRNIFHKCTPRDIRLLQKVEEQSATGKELDLQKLVYLGWPLFRIINRWFTLYVFDWLTGLGFNMGIVLILITLLLKVITYPLVKKSYMSSAKMRVLRPKIEEATKQYDKPEDQMMKQQAMMAMYSKYGVSPLSGCLPVLIQMPIWIAMFNFVPNAIQLRGESFLWINDLSTYDPIIEWDKNIWLIGDHLSLTCILFCVANVLYSIMSMRQQRDQLVGQQAEQMKMMQWMMYIMPVMFFFIFNDYSAGLNFYYFISLFFSAAIMWILRKTTNDEKLLAILEARYKENQNNPKKTSGMAARMEEMQRQMEEMRKMREQGRK